MNKTHIEKLGFQDQDRTSPVHDKIQMYVFDNIKNILVDISKKGLTEDNIKVESLELEKPIINKGYGNSQFIVGFADVYCSARIGPNSYDFIIEIKSKIESLGGLLRQISTYKTYSRTNTIFIIVCEDDSLKNVIESQGYKFHKPLLWN